MQYDKYKHIHTDLHGQLLAKRAIDWKVINEWVWFESRICREWLQGLIWVTQVWKIPAMVALCIHLWMLEVVQGKNSVYDQIEVGWWSGSANACKSIHISRGLISVQCFQLIPASSFCACLCWYPFSWYLHTVLYPHQWKLNLDLWY